MQTAIAQVPRLAKAVQETDLIALTAEIINENPQIMADFVNAQLLEGKDSKGEYLSPTYSQDPWFKRVGAAERYAAWKQRITPNPNRPQDVPNLFINGKYHKGLTAQVTGEQITYFNLDDNASMIEAKFGGATTLYGLNAEGKVKFREYVWPQLRALLFAKLRASVSI